MKSACVFSFIVVAAMSSIAADAQDYRRVPVTDAAELAALGMSEDAENIFRIEYEQPADLKVLRGNIGADPRAIGQNWSLIMGTEFTGIDNRFSRIPTGYPAELICQTGSAERRARARVPLEFDRRLTFLDIWAYDGSATADLTVRLWESCSPGFESGSPLITQIGTLTTSGSAGHVATWIGLPGIYPDTVQCSYYAEADFGDGCPASGFDLRLSAVRVIWSNGDVLLADD